MVNEEESKPLLKGRKKYVLEIISCFYFFSKYATLPLIQQYIYFLVERKHNVTKTLYKDINTYIHEVENIRSFLKISNSSTEDMNFNYTDSVNLVMQLNQEASSIVLRLTLAECLPAVVSIIFLGFTSDVIGKRKFLMWLPCFGNCLFVLGFILPEYISRADLDSPVIMACFYASCIISGLSGSAFGYMSGSGSYISDTGLPEKRTSRLALIESVIGLTFGFAALFNGVWISYSIHFEVPLWTIFGLSFVAGIGVLFFLPEPYPEFYQIHQSLSDKVKEVLAQGKTVFSLKLGLETYFMSASFLLYAIVQGGQERTFVLFLLNRPLSWSPLEVGIFLCLVYALAGLGSWPGYNLLSRCFSDLDILMISLVSMFLGTIIMIVSQYMLVIYFAAIIKLFHLLPYVICRSLISQQVDKDNQGSIYAVLHSMLAVASFVGPLMHVWIFVETLNVLNGFTFVVSSILIIPSFSLILIIKCRECRQKDCSQMKSDNVKDKYILVAETDK